jgi:hypothetical protein
LGKHAAAPFIKLNLRGPYNGLVSPNIVTDEVNLKTNYIDNFYTLDPGRFMDV